MMCCVFSTRTFTPAPTRRVEVTTERVSNTSTRRVAEERESDGMPRSWLAVLLATHSTRAQTEAERTQQLLLKEAVDLQARNATGNGKFPLSTGAWFLTVR